MTDALSVLHVSDYRRAGGAELVARTLAEIQREMGLDSRLFTARDQPDVSPWKLERFVNLEARQRIRTLIADQRPKVIHLHNTYHSVSPLGEYEIARYVRERSVEGDPVCLVLSAHDYANVCPSPTAQVFSRDSVPHDLEFGSLPLSVGSVLRHRWDRRGRIASAGRGVQFILRRSLAGAIGHYDLVICGSELSAEAFDRVGARTETITLFADVDRSLVTERRSADRAPDQALQAVYIGRLDDLKGVDQLLWSWPEGADRLRVVGSGPAEAQLRQIVARRGLRSVEFAGEADRRQVGEELRAADVLVVPTRGRETGGLSVLEAAAVGLPVIVPRGTALAELSWRVPGSVVLDRFDIDLLRHALDDVRSRTTQPSPDATVPDPRAYVEEVTVWYERLLDEMRQPARRRPSTSSRAVPRREVAVEERPALRVLSVNDYSTSAGGAEVIWRRTHQLLRADGVDSHLLAGDKVLRRRTPWSYVNSTQFADRIRAVSSELQPDVVHLHNFHHLCSPAVLAAVRDARAAGDIKAVVATAHDFHLLSPNPGLMRGTRTSRSDLLDPRTHVGVRQKLLWRWDEVAWYRSALRSMQHVLAYDIRQLREVIDVVLCPSEFLADALSQVVETEVLLNPAPAAVQTNKDPDDLTAVFAGRITPEKGLVPFLETAPRSLLDRLIVVGRGDDGHQARQVAAERGAATEFVGARPRQEVLELLERAHLVVLPSRCYENSPMILLEGLSRQANFLASGLGGITEIGSRSGTGFLFDPWDTASLEAAVEAMWQAFEAGTLNRFDAGEYLESCSESEYVEHLLATYRARAV